MKFFNRDAPTRRLKFTDNSGYLTDRLVEIPHSSCPTHDAAAEQVPKLHLWLHPTTDANAGAWGERRTDIPAGERPNVPRQRGARQDQRTPMRFPGPNEEGEMPEASFEQGAEPRRLYDRHDQTGPSPASTPSPASSMAAPDEDDGRPLYPPHEWNRPGTELDELGNERWIRGGGDRRMIDARTVKISGTDQHGKLWKMTTWGPYSERGEGANVDPIDPGEQRLTKQMSRDGANMLRNLEHNSGNMVAGLRVLQARLSAHYRR
jgi:hypothetical protein